MQTRYSMSIDLELYAAAPTREYAAVYVRTEDEVIAALKGICAYRGHSAFSTVHHWPLFSKDIDPDLDLEIRIKPCTKDKIDMHVSTGERIIDVVSPTDDEIVIHKCTQADAGSKPFAIYFKRT